VMTGRERVAVEGVALQGPGVQHELAAFGLGRRRRDRLLAIDVLIASWFRKAAIYGPLAAAGSEGPSAASARRSDHKRPTSQLGYWA
jgi:hypothetical protein